MPELPPPPDVSTPVGGSAPASAVAALVRAWVIDASGRVSGRQVLGLAGGVLALMVVGVVAWRAFVVGEFGGGGPPPELTMPRAAGAGPGPGGDGGSGAGVALGTAAGGSTVPGSGSSGAAGSVVVAHVAGAVARPGLYRLGGSPRIADAIDAAGGPAPDADLDVVNLAAPVADGERVYLPRRGEPPPALAAGTPTAAAGPLDLNTATSEQLEELPGVGPSTAAAILAYRQEHGRFRSVDELLEVRGIGEARLAELRPRVRVR